MELIQYIAAISLSLLFLGSGIYIYIYIYQGNQKNLVKKKNNI